MDLKALEMNDLTADTVKEARDKLDRVRIQHYVSDYNEAIIEIDKLDTSDPGYKAQFAELLEIAHSSLKQLEPDPLIANQDSQNRHLLQIARSVSGVGSIVGVKGL